MVNGIKKGVRRRTEKSENWKGGVPRKHIKLKSENWKMKRVFAEGAIQIEKWKMGLPRDQYKVKSGNWKECSSRGRRTIEAPTTSENHRSKQNDSPVRQNFMAIPLFLKLFSMACRLVSFLGQVFENTAKAILFAPRRRGGNLSMVSFNCSTALPESPPFNSTKYWSAYSSLSNKLSHLEPSAAVKTHPSTWMAR